MIDTHHHLWNYTPEDFAWITEDMPAIRRSFTPTDLSEVLEENNIDAAITVQVGTNLEENQYLLDQATACDKIKAIVGWADLASPEISAQLDTIQQTPIIRGIREIIQGQPDEKFLTNPAFNNGLKHLAQRNLTFDLLIFQNQLPTAIDFIDRHPDLNIILDHCAKPEIRANDYPAFWDTHIRELAKRPNLTCKLSGLTTEIRDHSPPTPELLQPYLDTLLDSFGPTRLMYGSDWPVSLLGTTYAQWKNTVMTLIAPLSSDEQTAITHNNAQKTYHLT